MCSNQTAAAAPARPPLLAPLPTPTECGLAADRPAHARRWQPRRLARGFSLVEVMVVVVIIGLLAGLVTINVRGYMVRAKQSAAKVEIATLTEAIESFYTVYDRYPTNEEGLEILITPSEQLPEPLLTRVPNDPWGRPYAYNQPGRDGPYEVVSFGADGREGGDGADGDIGSWNLEEEADS